jgi:hypothetical protein
MELGHSRSRKFSLPERDPEAGLIHLPNKHYFGGVFLTERGARTLRTLVNREGFVPDTGYPTLVTLVRKGIDLSTRVQAAVTAEKRAERAAERRNIRANYGERPSAEVAIMPTAQAIQSTVLEAKSHAAKARQHVAAGRIAAAASEFETALTRVEQIAGSSDELLVENAMIRVLASVGTQLASFIHEINGLLEMATAVDKSLAGIKSTAGLSSIHRREIAALQRQTGDLKRTLERHAS